jgi:hypothetical protein
MGKVGLFANCVVSALNDFKLVGPFHSVGRSKEWGVGLYIIGFGSSSFLRKGRSAEC